MQRLVFFMEDRVMLDMNGNDEKTGKRKHPKFITGRDLKASTLGWELALPIVAGPVIGHFVDVRFQTKPVFTLLSFGFGLVTGIYFIVKFILREFLEIRIKGQEGKKKNE